MLLRLGDLYQQHARPAGDTLAHRTARALHGTIAATFNNQSGRGRAGATTTAQAARGPKPGASGHRSSLRPVQPGRASFCAGGPDDAKAMLAKLDPVQLPDVLVLQGALLELEAGGRSRGALDLYRRYRQSRRRPLTRPAAFPSDRRLRRWVDTMARF